jgi:hypothetical protein
MVVLVTGQEWLAYLSKLDEACRRLSQAIILRVHHILNRDRLVYFDDIQRVHRRLDRHKQRIEGLEERERERNG